MSCLSAGHCFPWPICFFWSKYDFNGRNPTRKFSSNRREFPINSTSYSCICSNLSASLLFLMSTPIFFSMRYLSISSWIRQSSVFNLGVCLNMNSMSPSSRWSVSHKTTGRMLINQIEGASRTLSNMRSITSATCFKAIDGRGFCRISVSVCCWHCYYLED